MKADLLTALESMNVLNQWVRKTGCSRPRKAVYWLKGRYAIRDAVMAGMTTKLRLVQATVKCNRCYNGQYFDWNGYPRGACYHCNGKGQATLKFVETQIDNRWTWHTPLAYNTWHGWPMNDLVAEEQDGWFPGREGIDLDLEEAVRHLNVVEGYWQQWMKETPYEHGWDEYDSTRYYTFNYRLELPPFGDGGTCWRCGNPKSLNCIVTFPPGLETQWPTCKACSDDPKIWEGIKAMPLLPLSPELKAWYDRHMTVFADIWKMRWDNGAEEWQLRRKRELVA